MKNPIPHGAKALQTKTPAARHEFEAKLAAFKTAHGLKERYSMHCYCSRFGNPFEVVFERTNDRERFAVCKIEKLLDGRSAQRADTPASTKTFDADLFGMSGWSCPYCSASSYVHCSCGVNTCSHQLSNAHDGLHRCEPGCGGVARPIRLTEMPATAAGSAPAALPARAPPSLPATNRASLSGSRLPGLPGPGK